MENDQCEVFGMLEPHIKKVHDIAQTMPRPEDALSIARRLLVKEIEIIHLETKHIFSQVQSPLTRYLEYLIHVINTASLEDIVEHKAPITCAEVAPFSFGEMCWIKARALTMCDPVYKVERDAEAPTK